MINRKIALAIMAISAALAVFPVAAEEKDPIRVFNASQAQVKSACDANDGKYYESTDSSGNLDGYGCMTDSGAWADCNAQQECMGQPPQQRTVRRVRRSPSDRPSAALPRPRN